MRQTIYCWLAIAFLRATTALVQEDIFIPEHCMNIAEHSDHVLFTYKIKYESLSLGVATSPKLEVQHLVLDEFGSPVHQALKGMCPNATRLIKFTTETDTDLSPLFPPTSNYSPVDEAVEVELTVHHVTTANDFRIFDAFRAFNYSQIIDYIEAHIGVNAYDEGGNTPIMLAAQDGGIPLIAALLNARMPKVNVNQAKLSGHSAIFYSIVHSKPTVLNALLRRGANPNVSLKTEESFGATPLHFACTLEQIKHAEMLLEYGADPMAMNGNGLTPLQMLPSDAVRSNKMRLASAFRDAIQKRTTSNRDNAMAKDL